jgi:hypothetical protein
MASPTLRLPTPRRSPRRPRPFEQAQHPKPACLPHREKSSSKDDSDIFLPSAPLSPCASTGFFDVDAGTPVRWWRRTGQAAIHISRPLIAARRVTSHLERAWPNLLNPGRRIECCAFPAPCQSHEPTGAAIRSQVSGLVPGDQHKDETDDPNRNGPGRDSAACHDHGVPERLRWWQQRRPAGWRATACSREQAFSPWPRWRRDGVTHARPAGRWRLSPNQPW